jgi:hypothetical protein
MGNSPEIDKEWNIKISAISHIKRAKEGQQLMQEGRPLSEMKTPVEGPTEEYVRLKRQEFIDRVQSMDNNSLEGLLKETEDSIKRLSGVELAGNSELLWQRIVILEKLEPE